MKKTLITLALTLLTLISLLVVPVHADSPDGLCPEMAAHVASHQASGNACGYSEGSPYGNCLHAGHNPGDRCNGLTCGKEAHNCYDDSGASCDYPICTKAHAHNDSCYLCKHQQHDESCAAPASPCTFLSSHVHNENCFPASIPSAPSAPFVEPTYYADYEEDVTYILPEPADAEDYRVVCRVLNVRADASTNLPRISTVRRGDAVSVVAWEGRWAKIEWNGAFAYVFGAYIAEA